MQLNESLEQFREQGLEVTGISYDSVAIVRHFSERAGIQFPLLADSNASNIRAFGVVNTKVSPERHLANHPQGPTIHGNPLLDSRQVQNLRFWILEIVNLDPGIRLDGKG